MVIVTKSWVLTTLSIGLLLTLWFALARAYPVYVVPSPWRVWDRLWLLVGSGELGHQLLATLLPTLSGFLITSIYGTLLGFAAVEFRLIRYLAWPYVILLQSIPVVALLPLLVIWFGNTALTELLIVVVIAFYPTYQSAYKGFALGDPEKRALLSIYNTGRWQRFLTLDWPLALPQIIAGLRVGISFCLIGSVVYELLLGHEGLGYLVGLGRARLDTALVFSALVCLVVVGLALQGLVQLLEKMALALR